MSSDLGPRVDLRRTSTIQTTVFQGFTAGLARVSKKCSNTHLIAPCHNLILKSKRKKRRAVVETRPTYVSATGRPLLLALFLPFLSATRRKPSRSYLLTCEWDQSSTSSITSGHVCHSETNAKAADFHVIAMTIEATILLCGREMKKELFALHCFASPISSSPIS